MLHCVDEVHRGKFLKLWVVLALLYFCGIDARASTLPPAGTLVVIVPSRQGLVIAADSRSSIGSTYCDNSFKIIEATRPSRTSAAVTGNDQFIDAPGPGISDLCQYVTQAHRLLDIRKVVRDYLEHKNSEIDRLQIDDLALRCIVAVKEFQAASPLSL